LVPGALISSRHTFTHGDHEEHANRIANFRIVMEATGKQLAMLLAPNGPDILSFKQVGDNYG
ncbi:pyruvate kinase, partial [Vibrio parahaemolyticus]|nr:pyruvate kinase [Vibrio parahaemolyticus]